MLYAVPTTMRKSVVVQFHDLKSHPGVERTVKRIAEHYYFPRLRAYVKRHVSACMRCMVAKSKPGRQPGELHPIPPGNRPFATINIDHLGPFVTSTRGNKYVFVLVDNFSKFAIIRAVRDTKTTSVIRILEEVVELYGAPERIISDRGTCYTAKVFEDFCNKHGIKHTLNSPRHPQTNGQIERLNATLIAAIQTNLKDNEERTWDAHIRKIQCDLNEMKNASTGRSPFEVVFGYVPRRNEGLVRAILPTGEDKYCPPEEQHQQVRECIFKSQEQMKERYDAGRAKKNLYINKGSLVFVKAAPVATGESTKLQARYRGPLLVTEVLPSDTFRIADINADARGRRYVATAHASQLKIWQPDDDEHDSKADESDSGDSDTDHHDNEGETIDAGIEEEESTT